MPGKIFSRSLIQAMLDSSREMRSLSDLRCYSLLAFEPLATPQLQLPEVLAPSQYLIDMGFQPTLAQQLSKTYMDFVARYRTTCERHFSRAIHGCCHPLTEYYHNTFVTLFKRTIQVWESQFVSIVRVRICQVGASQASFRSGRVDIRVDDAAKAEIIARLGLKAMHFTSDRMVRSPSADVTSRLEEVPEQTHALSTGTANSRLMLPGSPPISSTSRYGDLFSKAAPQTCFPAPYPPPPASCLPQNPLVTSFIPPARPRDVRSLASYNPDVSLLTNLFGRMTTMTPETDSRIPRSHRVFRIPDSNGTKPLSPILSPSTADNSTERQLAGVESIASPIKPTNTLRRRKIAPLPTRRGKTSASQSPPIFDLARATSHPVSPRVEETFPYHVPSSQKTSFVSTLPAPYAVEAPCVATPKSSIPRQRKEHTLYRKALPQSHSIPQNQVLAPLVTSGETLSYTVSGSSPPVSDAHSYFDSPPTSSNELDTPPSTPPRSHVLLARTSTEGLAFSFESDGIVSHKESLGDAKLLNLSQRYIYPEFTKGGLGRDSQLLTFTFDI